jgi:hypothetical protein
MSDLNESEDTPPSEPEAFDFSKLRYLPKDTKIERMREWFLANYEDPAIGTPYHSDVGYLYVHGGPYDARDVLHEAFDEYVTPSVIDELAGDLTAECHEWAPLLSEQDLAEWYGQIAEEGPITEYYRVFSDAIENIHRLLAIDLPEEDRNFVYKLLFVNVITAMETYFCDAFSAAVLTDPALIRRYVEKSHDFKDQNLSLSKIYSVIDGIEDRIKEQFSNISWHNLAKVSGMYRDVLEIQFPRDLALIYRAIGTRHHIVHRNGKDQEGSLVIVSKDAVVELLTAVSDLVDVVDIKLPKRRRPEDDELPF